MMDQTLQTLITTSPLAAVLLACLWLVWRRLLEREAKLDEVQAEQRTFMSSLLGSLEEKDPKK